MSNLIAWIAAEAERPEVVSAGFPRRTRAREEKPATESLRAHQFPAKTAAAPGEIDERVPASATPPPFDSASPSGEAALRAGFPADDAENGAPSASYVALEEEDRERERRTYRGRTAAMLRRYMRYSIETGRLPSLLGREFFRAKVTAYTVVTFEDRVIFVHDMEKCLDRLDEFSRQLIGRHILQEHDRWATAKLLHCNEKTVRRYTPVVLDVLSEILIEVGLMKRMETVRRNSCQGGENDQIDASACDDGKYKV